MITICFLRDPDLCALKFVCDKSPLHKMRTENFYRLFEFFHNFATLLDYFYKGY
jgi:hypothetical protein